MSTVQIVAIAVAVVVVVLLIVALLVTRRRGSSPRSEGLETPEAVSFIDQMPQDTLSGLGKVEQPREETADVSESNVDDVASQSRLADDADVDLGVQVGSGEPAEVGEVETPEEARFTEATPTPTSGDEPIPTDASETTGELPAVGIEPAGGATEAFAVIDDEDSATPAGFFRADDAPAAGDGDRLQGMVALSDIIVTTSTKLVDLRDPDVRRMLTDLVRLEVDQAVEYRRQGQTVDAVLQLVEAEKISRALGLNESAERVHQMIEELNRLA